MNKAIEIIDKVLLEKLVDREFSAVETDSNGYGQMRMYKNETMAYSVIYDKKKQVFILRSGDLTEDDIVETWKNVSSWLYDLETGTQAEAESIARDFLDAILGSSSVEEYKALAVQKKKKKGKDDERNVDPTFFFNRLANFFPEIKDEMNKDKIEYGKVRFATLTTSCLVPKCEEFAKKPSQELKKLTELFNDMHNDGDKDVRGIVIHGLFNGLSDEAMNNIQENFSEDLKKLYKCSRPLKGKKIKAEKEKKQSKFMAQALENAREQQKTK
ncbi:MAG: hypothetical protein R3Y33_06635 [Clostridia bacterium]